MQVSQRENESKDSWNRRNRIAQNVEKWGWRVWCSECAFESRHKPSDGPLREARCTRWIVQEAPQRRPEICGGKLSRGISNGIVPRFRR